MNAKSLAVCVGVVVLAAAGSRVCAQTALGAGDALDGNLSLEGPTNFAQPAPDYRSRNLIVTGDVAGGRGFRGSVGYRAAEDFRGRLGSNDLFRFRADSAYTNPELFRLGTTYEQLRFGEYLGVVEYRRSATPPPPAADMLNDPRRVFAPGQVSPDAVRLDSLERPRSWRQLDRASFASSSPLAMETSIEPRVVGRVYAPNGTPLLVNASSARGLTAERADQFLGAVGVSTYDAARLRQDAAAGSSSLVLGGAFETPLNRQPPAAKPQGQIPDQRIEGRIQPDYNRVLERVAERFKALDGAESDEAAGDLDTRLGKSYWELREELSGSLKRASGSETQHKATGGRMESPRPGRLVEAVVADSAQGAVRSLSGRDNTSDGQGLTQDAAGARQPGVIPPSAKARAAPPVVTTTPAPPPSVPQPLRSPFAKDKMRQALQHGQTVERFAAPTRDRINELLSGGEQALREGDYFMAERRFERALRITPGHPMALAGMGHAQLGAGLYLSASMTLRSLLARQPEMIDVKYDPSLLPSRERLAEVVAALKTRMEHYAEDRAAYGFLLAYVGHQLGDRALMTHGLSALQSHPDDARLSELLQQVWLDSPPQTPSPAQPAQPAPEPGK